MIFVDTAVGSKDVLPLLLKAGLPAEPAHLEWADIEFVGRGIAGAPVRVGIELKRLGELTSDWDRFAGEQLPKMVTNYDYRYMFYEGEWIHDRATGDLMKRTKFGKLKRYHGLSNASALRKKIFGLSLRGNFLTEKTVDRVDTVRHIVDCYRIWTDVDFDDHKSHLVMYHPHGLFKISDFRQAVSAWPGISTRRSIAVESKFRNPVTKKGSVRKAAMATLTDWADIETVSDKGQTQRLGEKAAQTIVEFLEGK